MHVLTPARTRTLSPFEDKEGERAWKAALLGVQEEDQHGESTLSQRSEASVLLTLSSLLVTDAWFNENA